MKIVKVEKFPVEELMKRMKNVSLLTKPDHVLYKDAKIVYEKKKVESIVPCQRYVLKENLERVHEIEWALTDHGIDPYDLNGFVRIWFEGYDEPVDYLPPVLEWSEAEKCIVANDGMHRLYSAYLANKEIGCVVVSNLDPKYPYYAYPSPMKDPWEKFAMFEDDAAVPKGYITKWYRIKNKKDLYRNFNAKGAFENTSAPRNSSKKES